MTGRWLTLQENDKKDISPRGRQQFPESQPRQPSQHRLTTQSQRRSATGGKRRHAAESGKPLFRHNAVHIVMYVKGCPNIDCQQKEAQQGFKTLIAKSWSVL